MNDEADFKKSLEKFVLDGFDLERLEDLLAEPNVFEALGAVRSELRHSNFLAYLLDPSQNHGLGDIFLRQFLLRPLAIGSEAGTKIGPIEIGTWDFSDAGVWRERDNVDVLVISEANRFCLLIENKIYSTEHSNQFVKYRKEQINKRKDYRFVFVYLTIDGDEPSDSHYVPVTYGLVCQVLEEILDARGGGLGADTLLALRHYAKLIRRRFMGDTELNVLAATIYAKHRRALDFIFEQRPDIQSDIGAAVMELIRNNAELELVHSTKSSIRFVPKVWDDVADLRKGSGWTPSNRMLLFEFKNNPSRLAAALILGPGDSEIREKVFDAILANRDVFAPSSATLYPKWQTLWSENWFEVDLAAEQDFDAIRETIDGHWKKFLETGC